MAMVQASCDGDSKSYAAVWNMYGACDTCKNNSDSDLQKLAKDYKKWKDTNEFKEWENSHMQGFANYNSFKLDCIGHVQKKMGKALCDFQKSPPKIEDGKPVGGW